ncbi:hypothetical protein Tco_1024689 [Tanacetum coccineum]
MEMERFMSDLPMMKMMAMSLPGNSRTSNRPGRAGDGAGTVEGSMKGSGGCAYVIAGTTDALIDMKLPENKKKGRKF